MLKTKATEERIGYAMRKYFAVGALVCALALPSMAKSKHPVERPFKCVGIVTWTVNMETGDAIGEHAGLATHAGRFTSGCWALWDLENLVIVEGGGVSVTANRDKLFWIMNLKYPMAIQFTGGEGRFENASGVAPTVSFDVLKFEPDESTGVLTMVIEYVLEGTITY